MPGVRGMLRIARSGEQDSGVAFCNVQRRKVSVLEWGINREGPGAQGFAAIVVCLRVFFRLAKPSPIG